MRNFAVANLFIVFFVLGSITLVTYAFGFPHGISVDCVLIALSLNAIIMSVAYVGGAKWFGRLISSYELPSALIVVFVAVSAVLVMSVFDMFDTTSVFFIAFCVIKVFVAVALAVCATRFLVDYAEKYCLSRRSLILYSIGEFIVILAGLYFLKKGIWIVPALLAVLSVVFAARAHFRMSQYRFTIRQDEQKMKFEVFRFVDQGKEVSREDLSSLARSIGAVISIAERGVLLRNRDQIPSRCPPFYVFYGNDGEFTSKFVNHCKDENRLKIRICPPPTSQLTCKGRFFNPAPT